VAQARLVAYFIILTHLIGALSAVDAIMRARTAQGSIAWAALLLVVPYAAVPAYWVLGRSKFRGYVRAHRQRGETVRALANAASSATGAFALPPAARPRAGEVAERLVRFPFTGGNEVELLVDGDQTYASILRGVEGARRYVLFQFYIVRDDDIGREFQRLLIRKAREGVRVLFLHDEVGSHGLPRRYLRELREAGVRAHDFHSTRGPWNRFQLNFRNHRKIVVVDGHTAWLGGLNVGDEYRGRNPRFGAWRDTHLRVHGPAVLGAQFAFAEDWHWATGEVPSLNWNPRFEPERSAGVLIAPTGPADELESAGLMFTHAINTARERLWLASPYFIPDGATLAALQLAVLRGVDVRVLIPDRADHLMVYLAAFFYVEGAVAAGVEVFRYEEGFFHSKAMLVDDIAATVGSANFDNRSFRLNFELTAIVSDAAFSKEVEAMFEADFARARVVAPGEFTDRSFPFRLAVRLSRLASPVL
jgi:cardiolipin synthase A/B